VAYSNAGTVKIDSKVKDAEVFVNGAYAGTIKDNKTMHLRQGNYTIEVRHAGETTFSENVYVTAGKTLHINPAVYGRAIPRDNIAYAYCYPFRGGMPRPLRRGWRSRPRYRTCREV
jgi:hypothetical protein